MVSSVFFSFQYDPDNWRVQQVMKVGAISGKPLFTPQDWEKVRRKTDKAIKEWIQKQMLYTKDVIVLVGATTYKSHWVKYEIEKAWNDKRPLLGVRIHGLLDKDGRRASCGQNPFEHVSLRNGKTVADYVKLINPDGNNSKDVYRDIEENLEKWLKNYAYKQS
jgi:MTH538 TIR-like domain (DUF1863).